MRDFEQKVKNGTITTFFRGSGWNFFFEKAKTGSVRIGRFYTNGHVNSNFETLKWRNPEKLSLPTDFNEAESTYANFLKTQYK